MKRLFLILSVCALSVSAVGQETQYSSESNNNTAFRHQLTYMVEGQGSFSRGNTPLWLNANKYGLSSLTSSNGYIRGAFARPLRNDSLRRWGWGASVDVVAPWHYTSPVVVQQAYVEGRWLHGLLTIGAKEYPMELKNNALSSGAQTLGINARPVPQVRLALPEYWTIPAFGRWFHIKGHLAYGKMTDQKWQHDFTRKEHKYTDGGLYHSKAFYLRIGSEDRFAPLSVELGLESATLFGGTTHFPDPTGKKEIIVKNGSGIKSMIKALVPGGSDVPEQGTVYQNEEGDILGSWVARVNYDAELWRLGVYADKFFEDHSSLFMLDYDGYGTGERWNVKENTHYFRYDLKDWLLGAELNLKYGGWLRDIVVEYLYTKYQSGPVYHDHSAGRTDHISGRDNFYNHYIFPGWQHWGQAIGNPLYRSPLYNDNGQIRFENNRVMAWHLGLSGQPTERLNYRLLASFLKGWGTYDMPYTRMKQQVSLMLEATYHFPHAWNIKGACGVDMGHVIGNNIGVQFTISKTGFLR